MAAESWNDGGGGSGQRRTVGAVGAGGVVKLEAHEERHQLRVRGHQLVQGGGDRGGASDRDRRRRDGLQQAAGGAGDDGRWVSGERAGATGAAEEGARGGGSGEEREREERERERGGDAARHRHRHTGSQREPGGAARRGWEEDVGFIL